MVNLVLWVLFPDYLGVWQFVVVDCWFDLLGWVV